MLNVPLECSLSSGAYQLDIYMGSPSQSLVMHLVFILLGFQCRIQDPIYSSFPVVRVNLVK